MATQWMENWSIYGIDGSRDSRLFNGMYADNFLFSLQVDPDPTAGGGMVIRGNAGGTGGRLRRILNSPQTTVGIAQRMWLSTLQLGIGIKSSGAIFAMLTDVGDHEHCYVGVDASGYLRAYRCENGGADTLLGSSAGPVIVANGWQHVETKFVLHATAGSIEVKVEGVTKLLVNGVKTTSNLTGATGTAAGIKWWTPTDSSCQAYYKDVIVWDGTGAKNNDFFGSCLVYSIMPDADVSLNWTTSAGATGYNLINEVTPDDDTSFITAPHPSPAPYKCSLSDLPANVTSVRSVMTVHRSRKTDGGDGSIQPGLLFGGNTELGSSRPITTAYTYWGDVFDNAPDGGNWSRLTVNGMNLQLDRTV